VTARALVTSVVRGKAAAEMLAVLAPHFQAVFVTRSASARSLLAEELAALVPAGPAVHVVPAPLEALRQARALVSGAGDGGVGGGGQGLVVVAGSIFLVGELRAQLLGEPIDPIVTGDPLP
jgi:dihydrofolate synthase / folylpolyglutamate synthase